MKKKMVGIFICMLFLGISNLSVSGTLSEQVIYGDLIFLDWIEQKLIASDGADDDVFGCCVSIDGDYAIVGAPHDDNNGENSGSAYILKNNGTSWIEEQKLTASDGAGEDLFGYYVSISGDYAIVGAPYDDDKGEMSGSAYIFKNTGSSWIEEQKFTASDGAESDLFGFVSINGEYAIIGAPYDDDMGSNTGSVYIYKNDGSSWIEDQKLTTTDSDIFFGFGVTASINEKYAIIGAPYADDLGYNSGAVYIFKNNGGSWTEDQKLTASDGDADNWFGRCVSMDEDYIAIGAPKDDDNGENSGSVYIFKNNGQSWIEDQKLTTLDSASEDLFGSCVSIDGNNIIIGAENDDDNEEDSGSAYIFEYDGINWIEVTKLNASDGANEDYFGESVSIDSKYAVVGVGLDDNTNGVDAGSVYIFKRPNQPPNKPSITGPNSGKPGEELCWSFHSCDPDGDDINYFIDWGDGTNDVTDCVESCTNLTVCHTFSERLTYTIKVRASDCFPDGSVSDWSYLEVSIPRSRNRLLFNPNLFRFFQYFQIFFKELGKINIMNDFKIIYGVLKLEKMA
jgi:hypothetical protein